MSKVNLLPADLQYVVLPGKFCSPGLLPLYERAFNFWFKNWSDFFAQLDVKKVPNPDDFFRQEFVPILVHEKKVVAIHLYSIFDFRSDVVWQHSYIKTNFSPAFVHKCQEMKLFSMMSMESLFVDPDYRKSKIGIQLSEVLSSLGQQVFLNLTDCDALFAPARVDNKVAQMAYGIGFEPVEKNVMLNQTPVDYLICRRNSVRALQNESAFYVGHLWANQHLADSKRIRVPA